MNFRLEYVRSAKWVVAITVATASLEAASAQTNAVSAGSATVYKVQVTSPVQYFRELLAMQPSERERLLSKETPEKKKILLSKVEEYEAMSLDERELRLRMTQLRWYLVPLLKSPVSERTKLLSNIPSEDRPLIERRMHMWDQIPVQVQREFLEDELHLGYLLKWHGSNAEERAHLLQSFPVGQREKLESELEKWNSLPPERRDGMAARFNQFFELDEREKEKILGTLSQVDREQTERAIKSLEHVPADQRKQYLAAYNRFAKMSGEERKRFLKNAERWASMSEPEQNAWRELLRKSPPPTPPFPPGVPKALLPSSVARTNTPK